MTERMDGTTHRGADGESGPGGPLGADGMAGPGGPAGTVRSAEVIGSAGAGRAAGAAGVLGAAGPAGPAESAGSAGPRGAAGPAGAVAMAGSPGTGGSGGLRALASRHALVPLRIFLGLTFLYAGFDKLTDPAFLSATGSRSIGEMMRGVRDTAALPALVDLASHSPVGLGYALALGELAVGVGTLLGLLARVAALGGALISLSLWLTVSWQTSPYYLGNDLAYLMAWLPLLPAGAPVFSLDALLAERRRIR